MHTDEPKLALLQDLNVFAHTATPGSSMVYHVGLLAADRSDPDTATPQTPRERVIDATAKVAWSLRGVGLVALVQKKLAEGKYRYEMQKIAVQKVERHALWRET